MHSGSGEVKEFKEKKAQMAEHLKDKKTQQNKKNKPQNPFMYTHAACLCTYSMQWWRGEHSKDWQVLSHCTNSFCFLWRLISPDKKLKQGLSKPYRLISQSAFECAHSLWCDSQHKCKHALGVQRVYKALAGKHIVYSMLFGSIHNLTVAFEWSTAQQ